MIKRSERQQEIKRQLKQKKRQRLIIIGSTILVIVGVLTFVLLIFFNAFKKGTFNLKHIKVIGNTVLGEQVIADTAELKDERPIFLIDFNRVKANIDRHIQTDQLLMTLCFPDTIIIRIKEKPAICVTIENDKCYVIGSNRRVIGKLDFIGNTNIPIVSGFGELGDPEIGDQVVYATDSRFDDVEKMLQLFNGSGTLQKISEIVVLNQNTYKIITKNNVSFVVSDFDNFEKNYDLIGTIINENYNGLEFNLTTGSTPTMKEK